MNISDIIRGLLIKLDTIQQPQPEPTATIVITQQPEGELSPLSMAGNNDDEELARMKQIAGLLPVDADTEYANEPQEMYADVDAVTKDAGGGWMAPKHPSDIRVQHPSAYPGHQHKVGE
jgi:hypothetical protein